MSADNGDRTVFRQPMPGGDRTMMRPTPGARRPAAEPREPAAPSAAVPQARRSVPVQPTATFRTNTGLNPLVNSATTLIAVFEKTRQATNHPSVGSLHNNLVQEIRSFEQAVRDQGVKPEVALAARYMLCAALDEAVLNTPWGSESAWAQKSLLSVFHNETAGGEKFFMILDRMRQAPSENLDFLEFGYVLLSLGFEGKFRLHSRGRDAIEQIKDDLFATIRRFRGEYERTLSPTWQGLGKTRRSLTEYMPLWVVASVFAGVLFMSYSGFRYWLYSTATPVVQQLEQLSAPRE